MYSAVRAYLMASGALHRIGPGQRLQVVPGEGDGPEASSPDSPSEALVLKQAWDCLRDVYTRRGLSAKHAEALARLDVGETLAEAGAAVGISRQAVHQVAQRAGMRQGRMCA